MHKPLLVLLAIAIILLWSRLLYKKRKGQDIAGKKKKLVVMTFIVMLYYCSLDLLLAPTIGLVLTHKGSRLLENKIIWSYVRGGEDFREIMDTVGAPVNTLYNIFIVDAEYRKTLFAGPWKPNLFIAQYQIDEDFFTTVLERLNKEQEKILQYKEGNYQYYEINYQLGLAYNYEKQLLWIVYNNAASPTLVGSRYWIGYYIPDISWE